MAPHRNAGKAECQAGRDVGQGHVRALAAGVAIGDQPDAVPARDLLAREIEHMAKQAADRRAKHVQDVERAGYRHAQIRSMRE